MEMNRRKRFSLNSNWKFALHTHLVKNDLNTGVNLKPGKYFPAEVPGTIHTDLYKNKIIEDPFYSDNEL
ncbi:MAG: hypothetical protein KDC67_01025, partial [Ignavibacteriae bacterium]|nr:hypothetical protein [Ignavibacteriota bacterium]